MTHLHQRLQRLEAQAWEMEGRRLAQMTEAELEAEIVRVEAHYGGSIQEYEMFCRDALSQRAGGPRHGGPGNHAAVAARFQRWRHGRA